MLADLPLAVMRLPESDREAWPTILDGLEETSGVIQIVWLTDLAFAAAAHAMARRRSDVLLVSNREGAEGAIAALRRGQSLASIVYPPLDSAGAALVVAGHPVPDPGPWAPEPCTGEGPWIELTEGSVRVRVDLLDPLEREAVLERATGERPTPAQHPERRGHLLIGRANYAGQGRAWAQSVADHVPGFTAANLAFRVGRALVFDSDCLLSWLDFTDPITRLDLILEMAAPATHVLVEDLGVLFGLNNLREPKVNRETALFDADAILRSGRQLAMLVHGTAGRLVDQHRAIYPWSPHFDPNRPQTEREGEAAAANLEAIKTLDVPVFTATPDMLDYLPDAVWLPIVASQGDFSPAPPWGMGEKLRVLHAPSSEHKKGSAFVDPQLQRLADQGLIEYTSLRGRHPLTVPRLIRQADVVVDQVVLGNPATLMIQTLAAGRLPVLHAAAQVRRRYPEPLPALDTDPATLTDVIVDLARDRERYRPLAEAGPVVARKYHDGRYAAAVLDQHFLSLGAPR
jgi:hypothetical protein